MMNSATIKDASDVFWDSAWNIYDISFPVQEKRLKEEHERLLSDERFFSDVLLENNAVCGILFYWLLDGFAYIEHFAVIPSGRGRGIGSCVLKDFIKKHKKVVLEIEPPEDDISRRRCAFYEKLGFAICNIPYRHPSFGHRFEPYTLMLMSIGISLCEEDAESLMLFLEEIC